MRSNKYLRVFAILLAFALVAAACGDDDDSAADDGGDGADISGSIWVLLPDSASSARWEIDDRRFFKQCFEENGLVEGDDFTIVNAEADAAQQLSQAEQAVADNASVVLLVNLDSASGSTIIQTVQESGAKAIDYDRLTIEGDGADLYVSFDNVEVGRTMASVVGPEIEALESEGVPRVVMLNGGPTDNNSLLFRQGYNETVEPKVTAGDWELVADQGVPGWDNQEALTLFEQILTAAGNDVDGVFAANDGLANSVIVALQNAGLDATAIPVSGQDATAGGMQRVLEGTQSMSVYKPIEAEAFVACEAALALASEEELDSVTSDFDFAQIDIGPPEGGFTIPFFALTPIAVTTDNMGDTVIADGFRTWDEICTGEFEQYCPEDR